MVPKRRFGTALNARYNSVGNYTLVPVAFKLVWRWSGCQQYGCNSNHPGKLVDQLDTDDQTISKFQVVSSWNRSWFQLDSSTNSSWNFHQGTLYKMSTFIQNVGKLDPRLRTLSLTNLAACYRQLSVYPNQVFPICTVGCLPWLASHP